MFVIVFHLDDPVVVNISIEIASLHVDTGDMVWSNLLCDKTPLSLRIKSRATENLKTYIIIAAFLFYVEKIVGQLARSTMFFSIFFFHFAPFTELFAFAFY